MIKQFNVQAVTPTDSAHLSDFSLTRVLDAISAGVMVVDSEWRCRYINAGAAQLLGGTKHDYLDTIIWAHYPQGTSSNLYRQRHTVLSVQTGITLEEYDPAQKIYLEVKVDPVEDGFAIYLADTSERRQRQQCQEKSERKLQILADASTKLAGSLDYDATLQRIAEIAVPGLADWFSIEMRNSDDDLISRLAVTSTDPAGMALASQFEGSRYPFNPDAPLGSCHVMRTGTAELWTAVSEGLFTSPDYSEPQIQALRRMDIRSQIIVPLLARERVFGVLALATTGESGRRFSAADLTLAEELARRAAIAIDNAVLYREAQQAIREREAFLSIASHELRNPLAGLIGRAELLQRRIRREARFESRDQRDIVQIIQQAQRINTMLTDLLDCSVADTNQLEIHTASLDLNVLVQQVVSEIKPALTNHGLIVQSVPAPVVIYGDSVRLEQVVYNLISNAIKYSPSGSKITLTITTDQHWATICIADEGIGIPAEALPHIFKRFYRVANVVEQGYRGSGIGLYVVKDVITRHGGKVEVNSVEGIGSSFTVRLPLIDKYADHGSVYAQGLGSTG